MGPYRGDAKTERNVFIAVVATVIFIMMFVVFG